MQIEPLCEISPTLPASERGIARARLDVDEAPRVRADDAHAVRPAERDAGLATDADQLVLPAPARLVRSRRIPPSKATAARTPSGPRRRRRSSTRSWLTQNGEHVDAVGQVRDRGVAAAAEQGLVPGIDGVDRAREADAVQVLDDRAAHRGSLGGAEHGHGAGVQERVEQDSMRLQVARRPVDGPPHVRRRALIEAEPFLRLAEVAADHVRELLELDLHVGVEGVEVVHGDAGARTCTTCGRARTGGRPGCTARARSRRRRASM